jgi:CDP-6-deoxy-D-xylo-4-hexulose-3-dehydrase
MTKDEIKLNILNELKKLINFYRLKKETFIPGKTKIRLACRSYTESDVLEAIEAFLNWPTIGMKVEECEKKLAIYLGVKNAVMVSSGGTANFLILNFLTSPFVDDKIRLNPGDEIITPAVTWSTTVSPIVQVGCVPILADVNLGTFDINVEEIEKLITEKTRALMIVHPLGNVCDMDAIKKIVDEFDLILIEDTCESLGSKYKDKFVGTFGDFGTFSFYYSHLITSIEGGLIVTKNDYYADVFRSMRANGWLRDIKDKNLRERVLKENPNINPNFLFPFSGFNFKPSDVHAGLLLNQINRIEKYIEGRKKNADYLNYRLKKYENYLYLPFKKKDTKHCWFSYPIVVKPNPFFNKNNLVNFMEERNIETRPIISGNIADQPFIKNFKFKQGNLKNSKLIMEQGFYIGCHHFIGAKERQYIADTIETFIANHIK